LEVSSDITQYIEDGRRGERLRDGLYIAIIGPPNAGKSSLLNVLARRDAAIVSETAGTTRDVIEVHLDLGGYPVTLADTAGLRAVDETAEAAGQGSIEREGVRRARAGAAGADLKLAVFDLRDTPNFDRATLDLLDGDSLVILNKLDLVANPECFSVAGHAALPLSVKTGAGMGDLLARLETEVAGRLAAGGAAPVLTRARHRQALQDCAAAVARAGGAALPELMAEDLRLGVRALGRITGRVDVEDILDVIFRDFCIGK
jgi:tRNA modification GTPase